MSLKNLKNRLKSLTNKGNKDKTNTDSTKESRVKESKKEKLANKIADSLTKASKISVNSIQNVDELISLADNFVNNVSIALIKLPEGLTEKEVNKKYKFVSNVPNTAAAILLALEKATKGNEPRKSASITCHYLYHIRCKLIHYNTKEINYSTYFKELSILFNYASNNVASRSSLSPSLLEYDKLNKALTDVERVCSLISKQFSRLEKVYVASKVVADEFATIIVENKLV